MDLNSQSFSSSSSSSDSNSSSSSSSSSSNSSSDSDSTSSSDSDSDEEMEEIPTTSAKHLQRLERIALHHFKTQEKNIQSANKWPTHTNNPKKIKSTNLTMEDERDDEQLFSFDLPSFPNFEDNTHEQAVLPHKQNKPYSFKKETFPIQIEKTNVRKWSSMPSASQDQKQFGLLSKETAKQIKNELRELVLSSFNELKQEEEQQQREEEEQQQQEEKEKQKQQQEKETNNIQEKVIVVEKEKDKNDENDVNDEENRELKKRKLSEMENNEEIELKSKQKKQKINNSNNNELLSEVALSTVQQETYRYLSALTRKIFELRQYSGTFQSKQTFSSSMAGNVQTVISAAKLISTPDFILENLNSEFEILKEVEYDVLKSNRTRRANTTTTATTTTTTNKSTNPTTVKKRGTKK